MHYDRRRWIDEENTRVLNLEFKIPVDSVINKIINIHLDSSVVDYRYGVLSVWRYELGKDKLTGTIEIIKANPKVIVIKEDLYDAENDLKIKGKRKISVVDNN